MTTNEAAPAMADVIGQRRLCLDATPAVSNAVVDARIGLGVPHVPMPARPSSGSLASHHPATSTPSDTAGTDVGDHPGVTARTTTASPDGGQS